MSTDNPFTLSTRSPGTLTATEVRALIGVVLDLADDMGIPCAVVVVDGWGGVRASERLDGIGPDALDRAAAGARRALAEPGVPSVDRSVGSRALRPHDPVGALAVAGGPEGFARLACRAAANALRLG